MNASCGSADTYLVVEPGATYCSLDPPTFREGRPFATKSRLTVREGAYSLPALEGMTVTLEMRDQITELKADGELDVSATAAGIDIKGSFAAAGLRARKVLIRTDTRDGANYLLGDPTDVRAFYQGGRNLFVRIDDTVHYAPCEMHGAPDDVFTFDFADGSRLSLTVRTIHGSYQVGYLAGRLLAASGQIGSVAIDVRDREHLAYYGSSRAAADLAIPTLAVRIAEEADGCGVVLDASRWDTPQAVDGYIAHRLTCDGRLGEFLPLRAVARPSKYQLP